MSEDLTRSLAGERYTAQASLLHFFSDPSHECFTAQTVANLPFLTLEIPSLPPCSQRCRQQEAALTEHRELAENMEGENTQLRKMVRGLTI
jgi:hypothetical protein